MFCAASTIVELALDSFNAPAEMGREVVLPKAKYEPALLRKTPVCSRILGTVPIYLE